MMKVQVKWQKSTFDDVEVDTSQPPSLFKMQLFSLTGVPPERQKIMVKGGMLKDDSDWSKLKVKPGQRLMMMGTAGPIPTAPEPHAGGPEQDVDMDENNKSKGSALSGKGSAAGDAADAFKPPCGLDNLGNTCYMNATMQCLFSIDELKQALKKYNSTSTLDSSANLTSAARDLFQRMEMQPGSSQMQSGSTKSDAFDEDDAEMMYEEQSVSPNQFLTCLRQKFPQFAQQGAGGLYMQQDAEECYSQILHTFREKLDTEGSDNEGKVIQNLFGIEMETKLVCEESKEEVKEVQTVYTFKCNISKEVNHLHDGFRLSLCEDREKHSTALNRMSLFKGVSRITTLPEYLSVQLVRFLYRRDTQQKAKILRRVGFPLQMLDVFEFCSEEQKQKLQVRRDVWQKREDAKAELMKKQKKQKTNGQQSAALGDLDEESAKLIEKDFDPALAGHTGFYDLHAIVTHKGRIADSGHYVGWVKKKDQWVEFDDDKVYPITDEDVQKLDGGGDWHMAYLCIYKARLA